MGQRWFDEAELARMSEPTMDLVIAALDEGRIDEARALAERMKTEWGMLHDLLVEMVAGLVTYVHDQEGDEGVARAWQECFERGWRPHVEKIATIDRRRGVEVLGGPRGGPPTSGAGAVPR